MSLKLRSHFIEIPAYKLRLAVAPLILGSLYMLVMSPYFLWTDLSPLYTRLYRGAPVVEAPPLAFGLIPSLPLSVYLIVATTVAAWTGRKFDPTRNSNLWLFQKIILAILVKTITHLMPAVLTLTVVALIAGGYTTCSELAISSAQRKLFFVNDQRVCFKPDHYINDNWPCKTVNGKDICIQVDGR